MGWTYAKLEEALREWEADELGVPQGTYAIVSVVDRGGWESVKLGIREGIAGSARRKGIPASDVPAALTNGALVMAVTFALGFTLGLAVGLTF